MSEATLLSPYNDPLAERISDTIDHLGPYFEGTPTYSGDLAVRYYVHADGPTSPNPDSFGGLEVAGITRMGIANQFRVAHHHQTERGTQLSLVDPSTHIPIAVTTRIDARIATNEVPYRPNQTLPIPTREALFALTVHRARDVLRGQAVSSKTFADAQALLQIRPHMMDSARILGVLEDNGCPLHARLGLHEAEDAVAENPQLIADGPRSSIGRCADCVEHHEYPLASAFSIKGLLTAGTLRAWLSARR